MEKKITDGANDRPKNETIAQSGAGAPDDVGAPVEVSDEEVERVRQKLLGEKAQDSLKKEVNEATDLPQKGSA